MKEPVFHSLVALLEHRAEERPTQELFTFLSPTGEVAETLTYGELDASARRLGAHLDASGARGQRALLLYPPGLDFIQAFFGCLYAGVVAVPAYPPHPRRPSLRLESIFTDARPAFALTDSSLLSRTDTIPENLRESVEWLATDRLQSGNGEWLPRKAGRDSLAFLQYTSGSTSAPKGVMVTHGNLLHNEELIRQAFRQSEESIVVGWLPLYHDMGLIGNVLQPLYVGGRAVLMSPMAFLQKPFRWLEAVSRFRATTSGGPNFAYALCAQRIDAEELRELDLASWELAFCGAEPVRAATLDHFAERFAPCGFRRQALYPCYGLAESTLFVSGGSTTVDPVVEELSAEALEEGRVEPADDTDRATLQVGCGRAWEDTEIRIVDPQTKNPVPEARIGEIWVRSPSTAQGYWERDGETRETFEACLADGSGPFLRTGDLGFQRRGELFVTSRLKDLIIIRGRNYHPQDLELAAEQSSPRLRPGNSAAFSVDVEGAERLVLVLELRRGAMEEPEVLAATIRARLAELHEIEAYEVVFLAPGKIPKTSSGKIRRQACRAAYLSETLQVVARSVTKPDRATDVVPKVDVSKGPESVEAWLRSRLFGGSEAEEPGPIALDSLAAVQLKVDIEDELGAFVSVTDLLGGRHLSEIVEAIERGCEVEAESFRPAVSAAAPSRGLFPASVGQRALWFLEELAAESGVYHLIGALRVTTELDEEALERSWGRLAARHAALRTTLRVEDGDPRLQIHESLEPRVEVVPAEDMTPAEIDRRLADESRRPFRLETEPPVRLLVLSRAPTEHFLLVVVHHVAADLWSLGILMEELGRLYGEETGGMVADLPPVTFEYVDFVRQQRRWLDGKGGDEAWEYWRRRLSGELPVLDLPTDRPRPSAQTFRGDSRELDLGPEVTERIGELAHERRATRVGVWLAVYAVLLRRYTRQRDLLVGTPSSNRIHKAWENVVGYFVEPLVLRLDAGGNPTFRELVDRVAETLTEALEHQGYPFSLLTRRLAPERDPAVPPIFQTLFAYQSTSSARSRSELSALALQKSGVPLSLGPLEAETLSVGERRSPVDMTLTLALLGDRTGACLEFNPDLFDADTAERFLRHFGHLAEAATRTPERRLSELPLLAPEEERQILALGEPKAEARRTERVCLPDLVTARVRRHPEAVALIHEGGELSYRQLEKRSDAVAQRLRMAGIEAEDRVGVAMGRSTDLVVALLGVLKAGGAYVPLDPSYPRERLHMVLEDAGVKVLLGDEEGAAILSAGTQSQWIPWIDVGEISGDAEAAGPDVPGGTAEIHPSRLAYVIYTSGSTGRPKGVQISHGALVHFLHAMSSHPGLAEQDVLMAVTTISFDIAALELFLPLLQGARLALASRSVAGDGGALLERVRTVGATVLQGTPATWRMLIDAGWDGVPRLRVLCGGEALPVRLARELLARSDEVWNLYGPTETTVWSAVHRVREAGERVPLGRPVGRTVLRILDEGALAPLGAPGELTIGGPGLARGYLGRPALTADRFVPDPFSREAGRRLYRTGDLVRRRPDGSLEFLGRLDHQVKIRGFRIELGEIEVALGAHPDIREVVVTAVGTGPSESLLAAYLVPNTGISPDPEDLRAFLRQRLPEYMVPNAFVLLEELPLLPNGKVDRKRLPTPSPATSDGPRRLPRTPTEELIAQIWAEVLDREQIGVDENFFDLGGHSLLATQIVSRFGAVLQKDLPLSLFFENPTVARLARVLEGRGRVASLPPVEPRSDDEPLVLSYPQQRLWFLDQLEPGNAVYNMPYAVRLAGRFKPRAFEEALNQSVERHESLRTTFSDRAGQASPTVLPHLRLELPTVDLSGLRKEDLERTVTRMTRREFRRSFDLARGPLVRWRHLRLGAEEHILLVVLHHIISDGWSMGVLVRELGSFYHSWSRQGQPGRLPAPRLRYTDFAAWQVRTLPTPDDLDYWRETLSALPVLELPADHPRPSVETYAGGQIPVRLPVDLTEAVKGLARSRGATVYMILLTAFEILMGRHAGQTDFGVGTPIANRGQVELEDLIGFFANTLVMRADLSGAPTVEQLIERVKQTSLEAYEHQNMPFEGLVDELQPERDMSHNPLFQVMFVLQNAPLPPLDLDGLEMLPFPIDNQTSKFDLTLFLWEEAGAFAGTLEYNSDLFDRSTVLRLLDRFETLVRATAEAPDVPVDQASLLSGAERHQLLWEWTDTATGQESLLCVHHWVETQIAATPDAIAVTDGELQISYGELNRRANRLAHRLVALGVRPESLVGICVERSWQMVAALLAVLKAGGAGVALDPAYPKDRIAYIVEDARLVALITEESFDELFVGLPVPILRLESLWSDTVEEADDAPKVAVTLDNPLYAIYTSGSTGQPKGILVTHRAFSNLLDWQLRHSTLRDRARTAQFATFGFCVSFQETFTAWGSGGNLVLVQESLRRDLAALAGFLGRHDVERLHLPFAALKNLSEVSQDGTLLPRSLREVITAGEQLQVSPSVRRMLRHLAGCSLHNQYGASETHVITALTLMGSPDRWPDLPAVGQPVSNTRIFLLDSYFQPVPMGVPGEVCAGGACTPRGYLRDPVATARKLVPDPFSPDPGARLYRTGDLARFLPTGDILYLGRMDTQVKIRGYRVELGEVTTVLRQHPGIRDAAVLARSSKVGLRLVAYLVFADTEGVEAGELRAFLQQRLPEYMIPAHLMPVETLPVNANGKLDQEALPEPEPSRPELEQDFVAPRTPIEEMLVEIWQEVLGLEQVGVRDDFFELGGHSLLATQVIARVQDAFGISLPLRKLFEASRIEGLARLVDGALMEKIESMPEEEVAALLGENEDPVALAGEGSS